MGRHIHLATHLSVDDLEKRYRTAHEPHERSWWQILWLLAKGQTATTIAESTGYNRAWIGQITKRYNTEGLDGMVNRQHTTSWRAPRMLSVQQQEKLRQALAGPAPDGSKRWRARALADWMAAKLGRPVAAQRGWDYLQRLKHSQQAPAAPRAGQRRAARRLQKKLRSLMQAVSAAFPHAQVELWATNEHRISLKPLLRRIWAPIGQRTIAPDAASLVGFGLGAARAPTGSRPSSGGASRCSARSITSSAPGSPTSLPKDQIDWSKYLPEPRFHMLPRRWVVERTFAWLLVNRRLSRE